MTSRSPTRGYVNPTPSYMSREQMGEYLTDLRTNRPQRPNGARPLHSGPSRRSTDARTHPSRPSVSSIDSDQPREHSRTPSHASSITSRFIDNYLVNSATTSGRTSPEKPIHAPYVERSERQNERAEVRAVRQALEDIDSKDEQRVRETASAEAANLIWKHQNPNAPYEVQKRRSQHETQGSLGSLVTEPNTSLAVKSAPRVEGTVTEGQDLKDASDVREPTVSQISLEKDGLVDDGSKTSIEHHSDEQPADMAQEPQQTKLVKKFSLTNLRNRRRSSGNKRIPSGGKSKGVFTNPDDKIYEDPPENAQKLAEEIKPDPQEPIYVRKNPFARARAQKQISEKPSTELRGKKSDLENFRGRGAAAMETDLTAKPGRQNTPQVLDHVDKQEQPPRQENEGSVRYRNGIEVRSDDIRAATSMKLKDRSPRLPSPTVVTDNPGRPIVSFNSDWKPPEKELSQMTEIPPSILEQHGAPRPINEQNSQLNRTASVPATNHAPPRSSNVEPLNRADGARPAGRQAPTEGQPQPIKRNNTVPMISVDSCPPTSPPEAQPRGNPIPPIPVVIEPPSIVVEPSEGPTREQSKSGMQRPGQMKDMSKDARTGARPAPRHAATAPAAPRSHWTPMTRIGAQCAQCALPISGKIVTAAGSRYHPSCFKCHHCSELLECVAFYPEPQASRDARIDRITRRANGEDLDELQGLTAADDGDESMRFFCHLDYHEMFSPRCKSCKTPIEGEVIVACGAEWHVGHFFCAQCGDPFDPSTPFVEKDGFAWCINCHTNRFSTKCKKCRKPVTDTVVKALGAEWHEQCFCCSECGGGFHDGRYFLRAERQEPVCFACEERRLKA